jgi:cytochrome c556
MGIVGCGSLCQEEGTMKYRIPVGLIAATAVISVAVAQTATPAKTAEEAKAAIEARHNHFESIKKAYEPLGLMLRQPDKGGKEVDPAAVVAAAPKLIELANGIPAKFSVDTRPFKDVKTEKRERVARDAVWASAVDFKAKADALATSVKAAADAAKTGDKAATKKAITDIGKACGACHDNFTDKTA